jgi:hypothetical protein
LGRSMVWVNRHDNRILTREQARFIIWCLAYDRMQRRAAGFKYHTKGLAPKLAKTFGVSVQCIWQIALHRTWRSIRRPKPNEVREKIGEQAPGRVEDRNADRH